MCTISATTFNNVAQAISKNNKALNNLLANFQAELSNGITTDKLDLALVYRFCNDAYANTRDENIGLIAYDFGRPYFLGVPGYLVMSSSTIKVALERLARYHPLITDSSVLTFEEACADFILTVQPGGSYEAPRYFFDAVAALLLGLIHWLAHPSKVDPIRVEMPYPEPLETNDLTQLFGSHILFDAPHLRFTFDSDIQAIPVATCNPALDAVHSRYAEALLEERVKGSLVEKVRSAFSAGVSDGRLPSLENMALTLGMSKRTLQKSLENEGFTFSALQEQLRKELANNLLCTSTMSLKKITSLLGFCESSSLHKACQRWFGLSPGQLRARKTNSIEVL